MRIVQQNAQQLIPQAREIAKHAEEHHEKDKADAVRQVIDEILSRPEHEWFKQPTKSEQAANR